MSAIALILFTELFNIGGIQTYNRSLCDALESVFYNCEFTAISLRDLKKNEFKEWKNITIEFCDFINIKFFRNILFLLKAILLIFFEKPQFLICAHVSLSPLALFIKRTFFLNYVVLTYGIDVWGLNRGLKFHGLRNADMITAISEYSMLRMIKNGISKDKIKLLQPPIDTSIYRMDVKNQDLANRLDLRNKRVLLTVGRINSNERYKGHDMMLKILQKLGMEYVWLVIGEGDDISRLEQKAKDLGVIEKIRFLRYIKNAELIDYYNLCDVFIMLSQGEGFGIVFLEALACGKPVIGGNKDGSLESLINGKLGFVVDPDHIEEIISAVNLACTSKEDKTDSGYLRTQVEANFGTKIFNKKVKEILENLINARP